MKNSRFINPFIVLITARRREQNNWRNARRIEYRPRRNRLRTGIPWHRPLAGVSRRRPRRRGALRETCRRAAISLHRGKYLTAPFALRRARRRRSPPRTSRNVSGSPC